MNTYTHETCLCGLQGAPSLDSTAEVGPADFSGTYPPQPGYAEDFSGTSPPQPGHAEGGLAPAAKASQWGFTGVALDAASFECVCVRALCMSSLGHMSIQCHTSIRIF